MKRIALFLFFIIAIAVTGCGQKYIQEQNERNTRTLSQKASPVYLIEPGDTLDIKFYYNPHLDESVIVRPDGKIALQLVDEVRAAGITPGELDNLLTEKYSSELVDPIITVIIRTFQNLQIYVGGEVNNQGIISYAEGMTPFQAIIRAGGFKESARPEHTMIIRKGPDNRPIPIFVDLEKIALGTSDGPVFLLHPDDIVYIPLSAIGKANIFVRQYVKDLLLFQGVDLGFSYVLHW